MSRTRTERLVLGFFQDVYADSAAGVDLAEQHGLPVVSSPVSPRDVAEGIHEGIRPVTDSTVDSVRQAMLALAAEGLLDLEPVADEQLARLSGEQVAKVRAGDRLVDPGQLAADRLDETFDG